MNTEICPECEGDLIQDPETKVIVCNICGLILNQEHFRRRNTPRSSDNDIQIMLKIKAIISSIKIPDSSQNWRNVARVWGSENRNPYIDLIRLGKTLEIPWSIIERAAVLFKKYIELKILPDLFEDHYVESLLIACIIIVSREIGRNESDMIQEIDYYVRADPEEIRTALKILKESLDSGF